MYNTDGAVASRLPYLVPYLLSDAYTSPSLNSIAPRGHVMSTRHCSPSPTGLDEAAQDFLLNRIVDDPTCRQPAHSASSPSDGRRRQTLEPSEPPRFHCACRGATTTWKCYGIGNPYLWARVKANVGLFFFLLREKIGTLLPFPTRIPECSGMTETPRPSLGRALGRVEAER